jgi:phosphotransferase system enzyme I (PtsI)
VISATQGEVPTFTVARERVDHEVERLDEALALASSELDRRRELVAAQAGLKDAEIFGVQKLVLEDPGALKEVKEAIREQRINAESAVKKLIDRLGDTLGAIGDDRGFVADVSEPWKRVLDALIGRDRETVLSGQEKVVVAAAELTPRVVAFLSREFVLAVICEVGGRYSHGAVLARALGIPCVVGIPNLLARLEQDMLVAVDGDRGLLQLAPSDDDEADFEVRLERHRARERELAVLAQGPATTRDGQHLGVKANIEGLRDLETFDIGTIDGVGLFRTEFLYMERSEFPSEEEQYRIYRQVLERMGDKPVTMRTLDVGADKTLPYFKTPPEPNPALGWRGLRISLGWRDLMSVQLRALMRASVHGNLQILLPMVTSLEEIREVRSIFDATRADLLAQGYEVVPHIPVGAMIEVPSSFLTLKHIIKEIDFISVGTNDLVQYLLAVDRDNPWVSNLFEPYHPAVVMALEYIARTAKEAGKRSGVCGDMAGDAATAVMLLGMGFNSISAAAHFAPEIKHAVRSVEAKEARQLAKRVEAQALASGVREVLAEFGEHFDLTADALRVIDGTT